MIKSIYGNRQGHTYNYELTFSFNSIEDIGYAIDFKEIKRVGIQWVDDLLDHGMILNPKDEILIKATRDLGGKLWLMSLNGFWQYCNPSVENIAKEVFLAMELLFRNSYLSTGLDIHKVLIYETPNCWTECYRESISSEERQNFYGARIREIREYAEEKGKLEYDSRKSCNI